MKVLKYQPEVAGVAVSGKVVPDVDAVALAVGGDLAADVAHVVAVKLGLQNKIAIQSLPGGAKTWLSDVI